MRWLRPEFQQRGTAGQAVIDAAVLEVAGDDDADEAAAVPVARRPWPAGLAE